MSTTKFILNSKELSAKLSQVVGVINPSNTMPVLENVLFQSLDEQGKIKLTASDLETTFSNEIKADYANEVKVCVPGKLLLDIIKTFADQPLTFTVENSTLSISSSTGRYEIACSNADEYPSAPVVEETSEFVVSGDVLADCISRTLFAVGTDDLRPILTGILFQLFTDKIKFVATDAHKLAFIEHDIQYDGNEFEFVMPKKALALLKSYCAGNGDVTISYNQINACFMFGEIKIICRLIDGMYPAYKNVIPNNEKIMLIDRGLLLSSIDRVGKFSNRQTNQIRFKVQSGLLEISAEDIDYNNKAVETLVCDYSEKETLEIGFNGRFMLEVLKNISSTELAFKFSEPNRAAVIYPNENGQINESQLSLVMPVLLDSKN